ncbi:hypothetical protein L7F22_065740 [Adiantum nelumboides]|nr:hypothetical protein [Adiantum nelumboides]
MAVQTLPFSRPLMAKVPPTAAIACPTSSYRPAAKADGDDDATCIIEAFLGNLEFGGRADKDIAAAARHVDAHADATISSAILDAPTQENPATAMIAAHPAEGEIVAKIADAHAAAPPDIDATATFALEDAVDTREGKLLVLGKSTRSRPLAGTAHPGHPMQPRAHQQPLANQTTQVVESTTAPGEPMTAPSQPTPLRHAFCGAPSFARHPSCQPSPTAADCTLPCSPALAHPPLEAYSHRGGLAFREANRKVSTCYLTFLFLQKIKIWLSTYPREIFGGRLVRGVLRYLSNRKEFTSRRGIHQDVSAALKTLWLLYEANKLEHLLPYNEFYSKEISETADFFEEYLKWQQGKDDQTLVSFCQVPFILTPRAKSKILQVEADIWKNKIMKEAIWKQLTGDSFSYPFLVLTVRRAHLIHDTLGQLNVDKINYKKPLKVMFEGEEGVDEGGITKEFFQLLCRELFNVDYGMFTYNEEMRNFWFNSNSMESESTFELVGIILGLGIYNNVILDVHLPLVVYKKLLGLKPQLSDINDLQPQLAKSLQQLLDYDGDVENTFSLTFQVAYDYFGEIKTYDLQPDGGELPVTNENKEKYVELYVQYLLEDSIKNQFVPFNKGFQQVCGGDALQLCHYEELELIICGLPHFDFEALEKVTVYHGGYTKDSNIVKWFWKLVKEMTLEEKKSLLFFTTGNDRAPVGGLGSLQFIIQRNDGETDRLPTAHTCFNVLLLPEYKSKEKLENRLKLAISNATGFGLQ